MRGLAAALLLALGVAACGQKGPLYLPEPEPAAPAPEAPADEEGA